MLRRFALPIVGLTGALVLLVVAFRRVLFEDGQLVHFDASFFYYPLYLRVQQEWAAGRWPLWDPCQNGGTPLLGNPVAAVLYPGKLIYAIFPYAWGARLYVIAHTMIALAGMALFSRSCGVSAAGSTLASLGYAFGAPVLLLSGNVIFLVGAAWLPWGARAIDRLLRQEKRCGLAELAAVLALQVLGGDPQAAYLTSVAGAGYGVVLELVDRPGPRGRRVWSTVLGVVLVWVSVTLGLAAARPALPGWLPPARLLLPAAWGMVAAALAWRWYRRPRAAGLASRLAGLAGACALAAALSAVQLLPVLEFASRSVRVGEGVALDVYRFSLEPHRLIELVWPNPFGTLCPDNRSWLQAVLPTIDREPWIRSLYPGGLILILALAAAGLRQVPAWRAWLSVVAIVALAASLGKFASPLWWARWLPVSISSLGPHDPETLQWRGDGYFDDGTGSPYAILAALLPGFTAFRYPMKLVPFLAASLAALAGAGWDSLLTGKTERLRRLAWIGLGTSLLVLALALAGSAGDRAIRFLAARVPADTIYGPADIRGAWAATERALAHGAVVFAAAIVLVRLAPRRPWLASASALLLLTADLALANGGLIDTVPQAVFEGPSAAAVQIAAAERDQPSSGPFRIHRMANWLPPAFGLKDSPDRLREIVAWQRATLQPLHGLPLRLEYCATQGILELDDYALFLESGLVPIPAEMARALNIPAGRRIRYHPRRAFDIWGARYFLLPTYPEGWESEARGMAAFLAETELIYPDALTLSGKAVPAGKESWGVRQDWQLRRNRAAYPRAWLVHHARVRLPARGLDERGALMQFLLYNADPIWRDANHPVFDLRGGAVVETDRPDSLRGYLARTAVEPSESVRVVSHEPQRVELCAVLNRPGLVILADADYPGWTLTIDGAPAPIFRTNRLMRGAAVRTGKHTLVYTFEPMSFRIGALVSIAGCLVLLAVAGFPGGVGRRWLNSYWRR
jgi:hypothetical protein